MLVWLVDADAVGADALAAYAGWLGESERVRCARFVRAQRRRQFIVGRALLRVMLGRLLGREHDAIRLHERAGQAPCLIDGAGAGFSISHSGRWVACAVGLDNALGLDIECIDPARDVMALAEQAFDPIEVRMLMDCDAPSRHAAFYRLWCAHEARCKLGQPGAIEYPLQASGLAGVLACARPLASRPVMTLVRLDVP